MESGPPPKLSMQESGERDFKSTRSAGLIARGGALWKNTVDKAVWSQPVEGLGFQDRGFGRCPGGRRSQRRLGKRVGLMKEFLCHSRNSLAQLILLLGEQSHSLASNVPPIQKKKPTYTSPYRAPMGSSRVQAQSVRCVLLGIQARLCEMRVLKGGRADKMKHFL